MMGIVGKEFLGEVRPPPHQTATKEREREREREKVQKRTATRSRRGRVSQRTFPNQCFFFIDKLAQDYLINTVYYTLTESHQSSRAGTQIKDFGFLYFDFVLSFDPPVPSPVGRASCCFHSFHSIPFPWRCGGVSLIFCSKYLIQRC